MNRLLGSLLLSATVTTAFAQDGTNSPYSQFGLGELSQQGVGQSRGLNGVGIALHNGNQVNTANPASYAYVDSLTMLFDMGLSAAVTNMEENGRKMNSRTGNFDYAVGSFRLIKNVGVTFGVLPVSQVGYEFSSSSYLQEAQTTMTSTYGGSGGLHKLFVGAGARLFNTLSVGFNAGYLWGDIDRDVTLTASTAMNTLYKTYTASISNYSLDLGLQYDLRLSKDELVTLGLTYGLGHNLKADANCDIINSNATISKADTTKLSIANALALPHTFGAGLAYTRANRLTVGAEAELQRWGKLDFPYESGGTYALRSGLLKNSYRMTVGAEWTPKWNSRRLVDRVRYRLGAGYTTPYYKINGHNGPKQMSVSAGFGIPIQNQINARSYLNISGQWVRQSADGFIRENTFRINVGLTFNERWFAKWKVE